MKKLDEQSFDLKTFLEKYICIENWQEFMELFFQTKDYITGMLTPLKFTPLQKETFDALVKQYNEKKICDALIIKGRRAQQSSLIAGMACCYAIFNPNSSIYVIADLQDNAKKILHNYYALYLDTPFIRNLLGLIYGIDSKKTISISAETITICNGTIIKTASMIGASQGDRASIGAGDAIKFLHLTEYFGEYSAIQKTFDSMTLHKSINVFCIRESTPRPNCGIHQDYINSLSNLSSTIVLFYSWVEDQQNVFNAGDDYVPSGEVLKYKETYNLDLSIEQMAFMDLKLSKSSLKSFNEEYPATIELAFMQDGSGNFFEPDLISKSTIQQFETDKYTNSPDLNFHHTILGIDPAYTGKDKCIIVVRRFNLVIDIIEYKGYDTMQLFTRIYSIWKELVSKKHSVYKIFIDKTGSDGLVSLLRDNIGDGIIIPVCFGGEPFDKIKFLNKGAEMINDLKEAMKQGLKIPYNKSLMNQLSEIRFEYNMKSQLKREPKDQFKKRLGHSPDELDALALTYAYRIPTISNQPNNIDYYKSNAINDDVNYIKKFFS